MSAFPKDAIFHCESCGRETGNPEGCSRCRKKYGSRIPGGDFVEPVYCIGCGGELRDGRCLPEGCTDELGETNQCGAIRRR
jgi:hypothetical protein